MNKDLLFAVIAAASSACRPLDKLTFTQAMRLIDIELDTTSKFECVKYLEKNGSITSETATELNAEIYRQQDKPVPRA
jgi:hypothetical protein